jgi:7-cyano-7-deazaguanine reductase
MDNSSIDYAEGRVFDFEDESSIQPSFLETFDYAGPRQRVSYQMTEFTAVCPFSGLPD